MASEIDWNEFSSNNLERVTLQPNIPIIMGFASLRMDKLNVTDSVTQQKKSIPCLRLTVDNIDNKPQAAELTVTSKRLAAEVRAAHENGTLFKKLWKITKSGQGYMTKYTFLPHADKVIAAAITLSQQDGK